MMRVLKNDMIPLFLFRKSNHIFTVWQHLIMLVIRQYEGKSYRMFSEWFVEVRPHYTTLQWNKRMIIEWQRGHSIIYLFCWAWWFLLNMSPVMHAVRVCPTRTIFWWSLDSRDPDDIIFSKRIKKKKIHSLPFEDPLLNY